MPSKWELFKGYQLHALAFALEAAQGFPNDTLTLDACILLKAEINGELRRRGRQARKAAAQQNEGL